MTLASRLLTTLENSDIYWHVRRFVLRKRLEWTQRRCKHAVQRPAVTSRGPASQCPACLVVMDLTIAEFYARFGRMPPPF
jgi:hypothetical protein